MIKKIRSSKFSKIVACYLVMMLFLEMAQPMVMFALTGGPSQPEFQSFTPIGTSDMVDLSSGDFNYNIPIMDVGGYPLNLAYNSGVTMDQEASWVGLGWDMSVGQIGRQVRGLPDDFNGDKMTYENNMKPNTTIGGSVNVFLAPFGLNEVKASVGMGIKYNNYDGFGFTTNGGLSFDVSKNLSVGMNLESSSTDGVSVSPSVSLHQKYKDKDGLNNTVTGNLGVSMNSRKGIEAVTMSASKTKTIREAVPKTRDHGEYKGGSVGGALSFVDASFTPTKRVGMSSTNVMFSLNLEGAIVGVDPGVKFAGYMNTQGIKNSEKYKTERAFGYENTTSAGGSDILDFNREKDRTVTKNTVSLPVTNYTYDLYSVQGQGVSGMFRPYRGQVGYVYDNYTRDDSDGYSLGGEIGGGIGTHFGFDGTVTDSRSTSGVWSSGNAALYRVQEKKSGNEPNYEKVFFKNIGGFHVDKNMVDSNKSIMKNTGDYNPVAFKINGGKFSRGLANRYYNKYLPTQNLSTIIPNYSNTPYMIRDQYRLSRNQVIQKLTRKEATQYGFKTKFSPYSKRGIHDHHTSEIRILKEGGEHYVYGRAAYNVVKKEVTFDVGTTPVADCNTGLVAYNPNSDNTPNNSQSGDQYFNRVTTPAYPHTFLLTSILSSDYQDLTSDGLTDDDLGNYTKFSYENKNKDTNGKVTTYKWRVPYQENKANYDEGLRSINKDNKGNYQYGEKEMLYISKIETKTHIAIFKLSARKDGYGVKGENGGSDNSPSSKMWKLEKISLYSKPEYLSNPETATPIKEANFVYDYSLCKNVPNNLHEPFIGPSELANQGGKLTLKKIYFTYANSKMGKYTPYVFNYSDSNNYDYNQKAYDSWGNYKPIEEGLGCGTYDALSNTEYPYVDQSSKENSDLYTSAWLLKSIEMPSGGKMELSYESDEYRFVQNREVMQMFKVIGVSNNSNDIGNNVLYSGGIHAHYVIVKLDQACTNASFYEKYLKELRDKNVYFRFLLNMTDPNNENSDKYDYVTGYLDLDVNSNNIIDPGFNCFDIGDNHYAAIKIKMSSGTNPISKAGYYFGRQYLNNVVYSLTGNEDVNNIKGVIFSLVDLIPQLFDILRSPDQQLMDKNIASRFIPGKSWIRLMQPEDRKLGGGSRVKEIKIHDQWDVMTNHEGEEVYKQFYGQQYSYDTEVLENGLPVQKSSGVATYEPLGSKENPFVEPFYDRAHRETILSPDTQNYVELPFGESFYPSPKVTYSKVTVNNLPRSKTDAGIVKTVKKHATGKVVSEFFTSFDYPTISDVSVIDSQYDPSPLGSILNIYARTHLTMSQGFSIHTNDMDGKSKAQWVYPEGQKDYISGVEYKYEQTIDGTPNNSGKLNNKVVTIDAAGNIGENIVGVDYDVINDFRENESITETMGIHFNTEGLPLLIVFVIVPIPLPSYSYHENILRTSATTKVIHTSGILRETIAHDIGSAVSTKNLAWNADTGDVMVTQTVNEYNDKYYSFNFPGYWANKGMGLAANNIDLVSSIVPSITNQFKFNSTAHASAYLTKGDQIYITSKANKKGFKAWVVEVNGDNFKLIDKDGLLVKAESFIASNSTYGMMKVSKSGYHNMQTASMASITMMNNPLFNYNPTTGLATTPKTNIGSNPFLSTNWKDYRVINASAIEYNEEWPAQCECNLPKMTYNTDGKLTFEYEKNSDDDFDIIQSRSYNPFIYNVLGNWRPVKSYAYLTGRNIPDNPAYGATPRKTGFFNNFSSYYTYDGTKWVKNETNAAKWTFASEVTQYNPFGQEVENKDALKPNSRYSSALFGYNNRFPIAVASNTKYSEIAYDGFEDYDFSDCGSKSHFNYESALVPYEASISDKQAHTGKRSIKVATAKGVDRPREIVIKKKITNCATTQPKTNYIPRTKKNKKI